MKSNITKGQWHISSCLADYTGYTEHIAVWSKEDKVVCLVSPMSTATLEDRANAKAIQAVPTLIHACEMALRDTEMLLSGECECTPENLEATITVLKNALREAL